MVAIKTEQNFVKKNTDKTLFVSFSLEKYFPKVLVLLLKVLLKALCRKYF